MIRATAVFFLLFTIADIALPQYFCGGEEVAGLPLSSATLSGDAGDPVTDRSTIPTPEAPLPGQDSDQEPHEEDCFCCCAHVLPGMAFNATAAGELKTPQPPLEQESLPSPPLPLQYHPPRFA
ncbi:MAG: hypothetical protein M3416_00615 [Acidobacteriota bacterium]|nr:hypothetical protein [Acidobacteriota bacterium]